MFLDQEIKSDEEQDDSYGMTKLLKRINVNKSSLQKDMRSSVKPSEDSLVLNFES